MNKNEFLARRRSGIGGSDVAAILGLSKWKTPFQVWEDKTGRAQPGAETDILHFGNKLEQVIADEFSERHGVKVERRNRLFRHPEHPELIGNIDRYIIGGGILECETADKFTRHLWDESEDGAAGIPEYYLTKVQHYMYVTGWTEAYLAVLIGGNEYRDFHVPYDSGLAAMLAARCVEFWHKYVLTDTPPPLCSRDDVAAVFRLEPGTTVCATPEIEDAVAKLIEAKQNAKCAKAIEDELAAQVKIYIGNKEALINGSGKPIATWKQNKDLLEIVTAWDKIAEVAGISADLVAENMTIKVTPGARVLRLKTV